MHWIEIYLKSNRVTVSCGGGEGYDSAIYARRGGETAMGAKYKISGLTELYLAENYLGKRQELNPDQLH